MKKLAILLGVLFFLASFAFAAQKEWTVAVFLNGDNNLEGAAWDDIGEMAKVGSTDDVNIVVQFDRARGYDSSHGNWTDTRIFYIEKNNEKQIKDLGEVDMGDWREFVKFAKFVKANYPAKKYLFVIWNHGAGWKFTADDKVMKGISYDDSSNNHMTVQDMEKAFKEISNILGHKVDLFGMDACLMQMAEVSYQYRKYVKYVVGSEETEPGDGWPYDDFLKVLVKNPTMGPEELGRTISKKYGDSYSGGSQGSSAGSTQSAIEAAKLDDVAVAVSELGKAIIANINAVGGDFTKALRNADSFYYSDYKDAYDFAEILSKTSVKAVAEKAKAVMAAVKACVKEHHYAKSSYGKHEKSHGLSLYVPKKYQYRKDYENLAFAKDTGWDKALQASFAINARVSDVKKLARAVARGKASEDFLANVLSIKARLGDEDSFNAFIEEMNETKNYNLIKAANLVKEELTNLDVNEGADFGKYLSKILTYIF
jgi:hypothetical protein